MSGVTSGILVGDLHYLLFYSFCLSLLELLGYKDKLFVKGMKKSVENDLNAFFMLIMEERL